jgi:ABC-type amino acid transport substrate-binding protein
MTTVGYGDKAPKTYPGRLLGLFWMFASIIMISSFTAAITSSLTVAEIGTVISGPEDLPKVRVVCVKNSTGEEYLKKKQISCRGFSSAEDALQELVHGRADALVYDAPMLKYLINKDYEGKARVLERTLAPQAYGIALPQGSSLREFVNRVLLGKVNEPWWRETLFKYLGE